METIRGRKIRELDLNEFKKQLGDYDRVLLDLGTGDGRYARILARRFPGWFIIGLDACRENLRENS
ncbi:MAG TPA: class I SAM-dependent methyltransferase, partial [Anaerolineales bacterium]